MIIFKKEKFLDLEQTIAKDAFDDIEHPWEVLPKINAFIVSLGPLLPKELYEESGENVWIIKN